MDPAAFLLLVRTCAPSVDAQTARALVSVESNFNPYAIGVVGGSLERQPKNRREAIATVEALARDGWNFSVGLGQINRYNFARYALDHRSAFEPCANLRAMQGILQECFMRASKVEQEPQKALRYAFSCYYSGNFRTGFEQGYVQKVERAAGRFLQEAKLIKARAANAS